MQPLDQKEMLDRLKLIETMIAEGKRTTERWGWSFLLWGIGPLIAMLWAAQWQHADWAWPVTMGLCIIINGLVLKARKRRGESKTTIMRSVGAIWTCVGATVLLLAFGAVWSGVVDFRYIFVALFALAAVAHGASSLILRWWPQFLAAVVWWLASGLAFVLPAARLQELAAMALLLGNIVFGTWLTYCEWSGKDA
jgi:hypothetical protein